MKKEQEDVLAKYIAFIGGLFWLNCNATSLIGNEFIKRVNINLSKRLGWSTVYADLVRSFLKRNPQLSLWKAEAPVSAFNRPNIAAFLTIYYKFKEQMKISPNNIWKVNETSQSNIPNRLFGVAKNKLDHLCQQIGGNWWVLSKQYRLTAYAPCLASFLQRPLSAIFPLWGYRRRCKTVWLEKRMALFTIFKTLL